MAAPPGILRVLLAAAACVATLDQPLAAQTQSASAATPQAQEIDRLIAEAKADQISGHLAQMENAASTALAASRALGDKLRIAKSLMAYGVSLYSQARIDDALAAHREGAALAEALGERDLEARLQNGIGTELRDRGDYAGAVDALSRSLSIHRALGNRVEQSRCLRNLANLYFSLGNLADAEARAQEGFTLATDAGDVALQKLGLALIANLQGAEGDHLLAARTLRRAIAIPTPNAPQIDMEIYYNLSITERTLGHYDASMDASRRVLEIEATLPAAEYRAGAATNMGSALLQLHRNDEALDWLLKSRAVWRTFSADVLPVAVMETERWIARALRANGRSAEGLALSLDLVKQVERYLNGTRVNDLTQATAISTTSAIFIDTIDALFSAGRIQDAFDLSERYRARAFLMVLTESRTLAAPTLSSDQKRRADDLALRTSRAQKELWDADLAAARRVELNRTLSDIDDALDVLHREERRNNPKYAAIRYPEVATASSVMASLPADTAVVTYALGDDRSFAWVLSKRGVFATLLPGRATIEPRVNAYRQLLTEHPPVIESAARNAAIEHQGQALYRTLIAPFEDSLTDVKHLIVAPDGALQVLPFEALIRPASRRSTAKATASAAVPRWLVRNYSVSETPSISVLAELAASASAAPRPREFLGFGDPSYPATLGSEAGAGPQAPRALERGLRLTALPATRDEVVGIAGLYPRAAERVYLGKNAREEAVKTETLDQYRYVHFAAHASIDNLRPGHSGIVLSIDPASQEDGLLEADEVMSLHLNADLVTLSACSTGLGRVISGEGIVGLTRAFFFAGARSVAASLWNVNDEATSTLMRRFYGGLNRDLARDDALRAAKLSMLDSPDRRLRDPYFWAPFVLSGLTK